MAKWTEQRVCDECGKAYEAGHPSSKYCSLDCRMAAFRRRKRAKREARRLSASAKKSRAFLIERCPQGAALIDDDLLGDIGAAHFERVLKAALIILAECMDGSAA